VLGATGGAVLACWKTRRRWQAFASLAAGFIALNYIFVGWVLPGVERSKPVPPLARTIAERAAPGAKLGYFNMGLQSFVYYANRGRVEEIGLPVQAMAFFFDDRESWALMGSDEWEALRPLASNVCIADSHPLSIFDAKVSDIIARRPPELALLVKNHCGRGQ